MSLAVSKVNLGIALFGICLSCSSFINECVNLVLGSRDYGHCGISSFPCHVLFAKYSETYFKGNRVEFTKLLGVSICITQV